MGIDAEIAAFVAEMPAGDLNGQLDSGDSDGGAGSAEAPVPGEAEAGDVALTEATDAAEAPQEADVDSAAIAAAIKSKDVKAFLEALGPHADALIGGKAHRALRIAAKEADKAAEKAKKKDSDAHSLVKQLADKYGDPIAARKACEDGDVDSFITLVEKWSGRPWNDVMRWTTQGIAGRKERLDAADREGKAQSQLAAAKKEQAQAEVRQWVDGGVAKLAPELHHPEVVEMVMAEIRAGYAKGVTTPAKALPLVKAKLEAQYQRLKKVFDGGRGDPKPARPEAPAARAARSEGGNTRPRSLDEEIAAFVRENHL
jgi:hypothetical protein